MRRVHLDPDIGELPCGSSAVFLPQLHCYSTAGPDHVACCPVNSFLLQLRPGQHRMLHAALETRQRLLSRQQDPLQQGR